jgi:transcription initiation factor TFIIIB Brf1 subunit/transcription initiation factor TFIIB
MNSELEFKSELSSNDDSVNVMKKTRSSVHREQFKTIRRRRLDASKDIKTKKRNLLTRENYCSKCDKNSLTEIKGMILCNLCGLISHNKIDADQESYNYNDGKSDPTRTNMVDNYLIPSSNKGSVYGYNTKNYGHSNMIRSMNNWKIMNYKDNNMLHRFTTITNICKNEGISNIVIDNAKEIFYKIHNVYSPRRNKLLALMASSVIIASKKKNVGYNFDKIASMFNISVEVLRSMLNEFEQYWKNIGDKEERQQIKLAKASLDEDNKDGEVVIDKVYKQSQTVSTTNFKFYFSMLNIDSKYLQKIEKLERWINDNQILIEHVPKSVDACLIYTVCKLYDINVKKTKIAAVCGTSTITINKCYNKIIPHNDNIIKILNEN